MGERERGRSLEGGREGKGGGREREREVGARDCAPEFLPLKGRGDGFSLATGSADINVPPHHSHDDKKQ